MREFIVDSSSNGLHVVKAASKAFPGLKAADLYKALKHKDIRVDGKRVSSDIAVSEGQAVQVWLPDSLFEGEGDKIVKKNNDPDYKIVAETDNLLIVNKKQGIAVHSGKNTGDKNLIDVLREETNNKNLELCHRIDMNTGGLIMIAKNKAALEDAVKLFKQNLLIKRYRCLVIGRPDVGEAVICEDEAVMFEVSAFLEKTTYGDVFIHDEARPGDLPITTRYRVLNTWDNVGPDRITVSEIECELVTGRTHQIRAQFAHLGHPIVGDGNYGRNKTNMGFVGINGGKVKYQQLFATTLLLRRIPGDNMHSNLSGRKFEIVPRYGVEIKGRKKQ